MWVVEPFEVWSKTAEQAWSRLVKSFRSRTSVSWVAKNESATALIQDFGFVGAEERFGYGVDAPIVKYWV